MDFKKYPKYKPSGVEWIGEIPQEWKLERTKWVYTESKERNREFNYQDEDLLSVSEYYGVAKRAEKLDNNDILSRAESLSENKVVKIGELVINIMLAWKKGLGSSEFEGIVSPSYCVYRLKNDDYEPKYFHYLYRTDLYAESFRRFSRGIIESRLRLYSEEFFNILTLLPPTAEQTAIANFLDDKTAKIDTLIGKKKKLIELLKEERTAVINDAVTGKIPLSGGDKGVGYKDSGIDWLGKIPEHWEVKKLKYVGNIVLGKMLTNDNKGGYHLKPYLRAANLQWFDVNIDDVKEMWFSEAELTKLRIKEFDLLVSEGGEVGRTCIWRNELDECFIQNSVHKITINKDNNPVFFLYLIFSIGNIGFFESIVNRISIAHLTGEKIKDVPVWCPPVEEQQQIVQHIETETKRIDSTIQKIEKEIELLKEYRTALISEVVTGKIKVT